MDYAGVAGGPVDEDGFAVDEGALDGTEVAAVGGDGAMIAHHVVLMRWQRHFGDGAIVLIFGGNVWLAEELAVYEHVAMIDAEIVTGQCYHALDVAFLGIARIVKDHNVAAINGRDVIDEFVDEEAVAVFEARQHAGAFYAHRLIEKKNNEGCSHGRDDKIANPKQDAGRIGCWGRVRRSWRGCGGLLCGSGRGGGDGIGILIRNKTGTHLNPEYSEPRRLALA